jgi:dihydrofolate reductase
LIISLVVAAATNDAIGKEGKMPWRLPSDMKHFKNVTWGMPIIMGRKTFDTLGKALPGRKNIVITRQGGWSAPGVIPVKSLEDALFVARETDAKEAMVIGGGEIYRMAFEKTKRIYLTRIKAEPEGDTFFPKLDPKMWQLVSKRDHPADEKNPFEHSFQVWERIF